MGMGAVNTLDRVCAALGLLNGVPIEFKSSMDVPRGGVLTALPALLATGLFKHTDKHFALPKGYYQMSSIFQLLAFMALCRIKSVEQLRYSSPGEWGKLLGLDRAPEVRTLREKIHILSEEGRPKEWSSALCKEWMEASPDEASVLYIDGHVRVYHGNQTKLPRHYVARERLCLRATTDYWVNAMDGQPFFLVNKAVDPGLIKVLENDIVPRLKEDIPNQPTQKMLEEDPLLHRFTLIFDREGYSPVFMKRMREQAIACQTYHKYPEDNWPDEEFQNREVKLSSGEVVEMDMAERGTFLSNKLWVREIRKQTKSGKQTSVLSTDYQSNLELVASAMFARWSQENFFRYMRQNYGLDRLITYDTEDIPDAVKVVNPAYRELDRKVRRLASLLGRKLAQFGGMTLDEEIDHKRVVAYQQKKAALLETIEHLKKELDDLKVKRKSTERHIPVSQLPEEHRFKKLGTASKHFIDTIKMIAYRAETAMAYILREQMSRDDDTRSLLKAVFNSDANIIPDTKNKTLTIQLHNLATHCADKSLLYLLNELNNTETCFPETDLRLIFKLVSSQNPAGKEV